MHNFITTSECKKYTLKSRIIGNLTKVERYAFRFPKQKIPTCCIFTENQLTQLFIFLRPTFPFPFTNLWYFWQPCSKCLYVINKDIPSIIKTNCCFEFDSQVDLGTWWIGCFLVSPSSDECRIHRGRCTTFHRHTRDHPVRSMRCIPESV